MCKLAFSKTKDNTAYKKVLSMLKHQEEIVAGHSTGIAWIDDRGTHIRKSIGKVINYKAKYPDIPKTNITLGHSRYATVGVINEDNQHPISIMYNKKRIGYGVHNGTWRDYKQYEQYRNNNLINKTDSALLFSIYAIILEKYGDTLQNRIKALGTIRNLVIDEPNNNFIIMFNDGMVLFTGNVITYKVTEHNIGLMTFGLPNTTKKDKIYEVRGFDVKEYDYAMSEWIPKPKPLPTPKPSRNFFDYNDWWSSDIEIEKKPSKWKFFDGMAFKLIKSNIKTKNKARKYGEFLKKKHNLNYRVDEFNNTFNVYVR